MVEIINEHNILVEKHEAKKRSSGRLELYRTVLTEQIAEKTVVRITIFWLFLEAQQQSSTLHDSRTCLWLGE